MESLICDICNQNTSNEYTFSCDHRTCTDCFYKICNFNIDNIQKYTLDIEKEIDLKCISCISGKLKISKRSLHQKLYETTNKITETEPKLCNGHEKQLDVYCTQCKMQMCADCFSSHKVLPIFASHQQGDSKNFRSFPDKSCRLHDKLHFNYFCRGCNSFMRDL